MSRRDVLVEEVLDALVPERRHVSPQWEDVLRRAGIATAMARASRPMAARPRSRRRLTLALIGSALVLAALSPFGAAIAGLGRGAFDGLSSWLTGSPGRPAPREEQEGFAQRNAASYAAFPRGTTLRLLSEVRAGGKTFALLGFRSGESLCLRVIRTDLPQGRGANECVTLRELRHSAAPALVASQAWFSFGRPGITVDGIFGFADDTVRQLEIVRRRGSVSLLPIENNAFLALRARLSGTVKQHPPYDPIVRVAAVTRNGRRARVPYVPDFFGYAGQISGPSYYRPDAPHSRDLPGPVRVAPRFLGGTIGWLFRREPRGEPLTLAGRDSRMLGRPRFARVVQPDPGSPARIGIMLVRTTGPNTLPSGGPSVCALSLEPLTRGTAAVCMHGAHGRLFPAGQPLTWTYSSAQLLRLYGLAADGVASIDLYLASGRRIPAALRDNAFTLQAPFTQFPAKLVARDAGGRPIGIQVMPGPAHATPCPQPRFIRTVRQLSPPRLYERVDLATGRLGGVEILGRTLADVRAALGPPDRVYYGNRWQRAHGRAFYYGGTLPGEAAVRIDFARRGPRIVARQIALQSPSVVDSRLGHVLRLDPGGLQRRLRAFYGGVYRVSLAYGSEPARGCVGQLDGRTSSRQLVFGLNPYRPSRPYIILSD